MLTCSTRTVRFDLISLHADTIQVALEIIFVVFFFKFPWANKKESNVLLTDPRRDVFCIDWNLSGEISGISLSEEEIRGALSRHFELVWLCT